MRGNRNKTESPPGALTVAGGWGGFHPRRVGPAGGNSNQWPYWMTTFDPTEPPRGVSEAPTPEKVER